MSQPSIDILHTLDVLIKMWEFWAVAGGGFIGFCGWLTATFMKIYNLTKTGDQLREAVSRIEELVNKELRYNGSRSMKDVLDYLVASQNRAEAWNTALLNQSGIAAWRTDACGDVDWVNAAFTHQTGMGIEHLRGSLWLSMVCEEDRQRVEGQWLKCIERASPFMTTFLMPPGDDNCETVLMQAQPFFSPQKQGGKLLGFAGTIQITGKQ